MHCRWYYCDGHEFFLVVDIQSGKTCLYVSVSEVGKKGSAAKANNEVLFHNFKIMIKKNIKIDTSIVTDENTRHCDNWV